MESVLELADVLVAVGKSENAFTGTFALYVTAFILVAIVEFVHSLPVLHVVHPFSGIFVPVA